MKRRKECEGSVDSATGFNITPDNTSSTHVVKPLSPKESKRLKLSGGLVMMDSGSASLNDSPMQNTTILSYKSLFEKDSPAQNSTQPEK